MKITRQQLRRLIKEHIGSDEALSEEMEDKLVTAFFNNGPQGLMLAQSLGVEEFVEDFESILKKAKYMMNLSPKWKLIQHHPTTDLRIEYLNVRNQFRREVHNLMTLTLGIDDYQQSTAENDLNHPFHDVVSAYLEFAQNAQYAFTDYGLSISNLGAGRYSTMDI